MSSEEDAGFFEVPTKGPLTRSKSANQVVPQQFESQPLLKDPPQPVITTPFDHIFINILGWSKDHDCYQALVQNKFTTIDLVLGEKDETFSRLKFLHATLGRIHPPTMIEGQIRSLQDFIQECTDFYTNDQGEEYFLQVTTAQWKSFRKQYVQKMNMPSLSPIRENDAYQTPNRDSPFSNASANRVLPTKAEAFRREHRDQSVFKVLKYDSQWLTWVDSTRRQAQAQRCGEIMDPQYHPRNGEDEALLQEQNRYMIAVWDTVLKTDKARQILAKHSDSEDAQLIFFRAIGILL